MKTPIPSHPDCPVFTWDKGEQMTLLMNSGELRPIELNILPDGAVDDTPSVAIVLSNLRGQYWVAQISEHMLKPLIEALGYKK